MRLSMMITTTALTLLATTGAFAQEIDGTKFRDAAEGDWYHPVEIDALVTAGGHEQELYQTLTRIAEATGTRSNPDQPDTIMEYGPGNWAYEFAAAGDAAAARGDLIAAITYYHTAAAPHVGAPGQDAALEKARMVYAQAMQDIGTFEEIQIAHDGASFTAHLHLPAGDGPFPVLVMSNGSDMSSVISLRYYIDNLMPKGIAFLTLDTPGMGRSAAYDVSDGETEKLHVATINWAKGEARLDNDNIFMQGVSFTGHTSARLFTEHEDLDLAGIVYICGPLHAPFLAPPEAYEFFPKFTIDGVKTRLGLPTETDLDTFADSVRILSIDSVDAFDGDMIETPILAINTNDDPAAPLEDMDRLLARAANPDRVVFDLPGHCPPHDHREAIASSWIIANLR